MQRIYEMTLEILSVSTGNNHTMTECRRVLRSITLGHKKHGRKGDIQMIHDLYYSVVIGH